MSIKASIEAIEREMEAVKLAIDGKNATLEPLRAELAALIDQQQKLQTLVDAKVAEINTARGDGHAWLALKKKYGQLASARMQLRQAAGLTAPST